MSASADHKTERWNLRVAESDDTLVRAASSASGASVTAFVREAALREARRVLADRTHFELESADWRRFNELLDRPVRVPDRLRDLFSKPPVFD